MARIPLNDKQREVLVWIREGTPDGTYDDFRPRIVARTLHNRGLAEVRGHGPDWRATLTEEGLHYLEHGDYQPVLEAATTPSVRPGAPNKIPSQKQTPQPLAAAGEEGANRVPKPRKVGPTAAMMIALAEAQDHRVKIDLDQVQRYRLLARTAERYKKVPGGMQITVESDWRTRSAHVILEPLPEWRTRILVSIQVPATLRSPSDVIKKLSEREDFSIRPTEKRRALRLGQAFVAAARDRGYKISAVPAPRKDRWGYVQRTDENTGHLKVELGPDEYRLSIFQITDRVEHVATKSELARAGKGWALPQWDQVPTEKLGIRIDIGQYKFWGDTWVDRDDRHLEDALAQILNELELRHEASEEHRAAEERERIDRKCLWEAARENAILELAEHHRAEVLLAQVERWKQVTAIRDYIIQIERHSEHDLEHEAQQEAREWVAWAKQYLNRIDPLRGNLKLPEPPAPTPSALEPFMRGWSPYGPHRS